MPVSNFLGEMSSLVAPQRQQRLHLKNALMIFKGQRRLVGSAKEQCVQQMNVKMKMQDNVCDDVRTAGFQQYTQYARSLTWRRHNMPIHTIAPTPPLHSHTSTIHPTHTI